MALLLIARMMGLFRLARYQTRKGLRILCYHGWSQYDTHNWRPLMFMRRQIFEQRIEYLSKAGFTILSLSEAVQHLRSGTLPDCSVVITIDDGFQLTLELALPVLAARRFPATIYVTSYYAEKNTPVHNLLVQYLFWKSNKSGADLTTLGILDFDILNPDAGLKDALHRLVDLTLAEKDAYCRQLAKALGVSDSVASGFRDLHLMSPDDIRSAVDAGFDIQLHTRRHRFPVDRDMALKELNDNAADLRKCGAGPFEHFCYPSGLYDESHFQILRDFGITSATTTDPGFNYAGDNLYRLSRFVDSDDYSQIEFEAEMSGLTELARAGRSKFKSIPVD